MFRRRFLQLVAFSSTGALAPLAVVEAAAAKSVAYLVKGFSCPTCAVGLDTMLNRQKGVVSSNSTYPEGKVTVKFNPDAIRESAIRDYITGMGFTIDGEHQA